MNAVLEECRHSRSQIHQWRQGVEERKERETKMLCEQTVENAAAVVISFPHISGRKGQGYMLYHELGYISMNAYDSIKKHVKRLLGQELAGRDAFSPSIGEFEHIRANKPGEIWAEDFTELVVYGHRFKAALLIDVFDQYILGAHPSLRATAAFVAAPVVQALEGNYGQGPSMFLLSDNGRQYISDEHGVLLSSLEIVQRRIPACKPQYNGSVECGGKEFKNVFYNIWERREREDADKEKSLPERVCLAVKETTRCLNEEIPRPVLGGVTPADVHFGRDAEKRGAIAMYSQKEQKKNIPPWKRKYWDVLKEGISLSDMTVRELMTKFCFFFAKPLRRIARFNLEGVG